MANSVLRRGRLGKSLWAMKGSPYYPPDGGDAVLMVERARYLEDIEYD